MPLMLDPPPRPLPIARWTARPFSRALGSAEKHQSRSLPILCIQLAASITAEESSSPPASSKRTLTAGFSASRRATTDPDEPAPQTMKSYDPVVCLCVRTSISASPIFAADAHRGVGGEPRLPDVECRGAMPPCRSYWRALGAGCGSEKIMTAQNRLDLRCVIHCDRELSEAGLAATLRSE